MPTYSIVGGGSTGISALGQLVEQCLQTKTSLDEKIKIKVYEKNKENIATGFPFRLDTPQCWILNGPPAARFKLLPTGETLQQWMQTSFDTWKHEFPNVTKDEQFPPRALVGLYFKAQYEAIKNKAKVNNIEIEEVNEEVLALEPEQRDDSLLWKIFTKDGQSNISNAVILCFGHLPSDNFTDYRDLPGFISEPWDTEKLDRIPNNATVFTLGGHLTSIDVIARLMTQGKFTGKIVQVTRNPAVITQREINGDYSYINQQTVTNPYLQFQPNSLEWKTCKSLFWKSYGEVTKNKHPVAEIQTKIEKDPNVKASLAYQLAKINMISSNELSQNYPVDVDELHTYIEHFYVYLYESMLTVLKQEDYSLFQKEFYSMFVAYLASIPAKNAFMMLNLYSSEQVKQKSGFKNIVYDDEKKKFMLTFEDGAIIQADYVVNATGMGHDITKAAHNNHLLANLLNNGLIKPGRFGGIATNPNTAQIINAKGQISPSLFAMGPTVIFGEKLSPYAVFLACDSAQKTVETLRPVTFTTARKTCF